MSAALAVQIAIRARLVGASALTALVPSANILDRHERPAPDPAIILGQSQTVDEGDIARTVVRIWHTIHVWKREPSLEGCNAICGEIRRALMPARLLLSAPFHCADSYVADFRTFSDPDGVTSHGVVTVNALVQEVS